MDLGTITTILTSLGIGGLIGNFFQSFLQSKGKVNEREFNFKEQRYKALMILMWTSLNPKSELKHLRFYREDILDIKTLHRELKLELYNSLLYAEDNVIYSLRKFIEKINHQNYSSVALEMRKDLYGKKTKINFEDIKIKL